MDNISILDKQKFIFGRLFALSNRLQVYGDKYLAGENITISQMLLTAAIANFGSIPPTLCEVAELLSTSHQNVKQLALKLQHKGFISMEKDVEDGRALRLKLMDKTYLFWQQHQSKVKDFFSELFKDINEHETDLIYDGLNKLYDRALEIEIRRS